VLTSPSNRLGPGQVSSALVITLITIGLFSDIPATSLTLGILAVTFQTWLGCEIYRQILRHDDVSAVELIGIGFALGALLVVTVDQSLVTTPLRDIWPYVIPIVTFGMWSRRVRHKNPAVSGIDWKRTAALSLMFTSLGFFMLVQERYWPLWIGASFAILFLATTNLLDSGHQSRRHWFFISATSIVGVALVSRVVLSWRPKNWWIKTADIQFFEALGYSLAHFGWRDQVFAAGVPMKYHWLSYAWTGMVDRVISAEPWIVITRFAPIVVVVVIILLVETLARFLGLTARWLVVTYVFFIALNDFNFESFSMQFSYVWLLAAIVIALRYARDGSLPSLMLFWAFAIAAFLAKSSNIGIVLALIGSVAVVSVVLRPRKRLCLFAIEALGLGLVGLSYLLFYRGSGYSELANLGISGYAKDRFGDLDNLPTVLRAATAFFILIDALLPFLISSFAAAAAVLRLRRSVANTFQAHSQDALIAISLLAGLFLTSGVLSVFVTPYHEQEEYFLHAFVLLATIPTVRELMHVSSSMSRRYFWTLIVVSALVSGCFVALTPTNEGTTFATLARVLLASPTILAALFVVACIATLRFGLPEQQIRIWPHILVVSLVITSVTSNDQWIRRAGQFKHELLAADHQSRYLGDSSVRAAADLVRVNTSEQDIIASNYFCEGSRCEPDEYSPRRSDWTKGGEAMTLSVYSERRFLVSGYGFTWQNIEPPLDIRRRITQSLNPVSEDFQKFGTYKPQYFLRDLTMPCSCHDVDEFSEVARTSRFVLYRLD